MTGSFPRRVTLLLNPYARRAGRFDATGALHYLRRQGVCARLTVPTSVTAMRRAARMSAEEGDDLLLVVGGDGSIRLAAGELAGTNTALGAIPAGTADVWCREVGIPRRFRAAIDAHLGGQIVEVDLGRANGEPFLLMAGIGWDAFVARSVDPVTKRLLGPAAYVLYGFLRAPFLRLHDLDATLEPPELLDGFDERAARALIVFGNTRLYAGVTELTPAASARDGLLDVWTLTPRTLLAAAWRGVRRALGGSIAPVPGPRVARATIRAAGIPVQLDGDAVGETPLSIWVEPRALKVSVPAGPLRGALAG